jgi:hypothetical protein
VKRGSAQRVAHLRANEHDAKHALAERRVVGDLGAHEQSEEEGEPERPLREGSQKAVARGRVGTQLQRTHGGGGHDHQREHHLRWRVRHHEQRDARQQHLLHHLDDLEVPELRPIRLRERAQTHKFTQAVRDDDYRSDGMA